MIETKSISLRIEKKDVLNGVSLMIKPGEVHALMGPNGSGKSSLAQVLMGNPMYSEGVKGVIELGGKDITTLGPTERAKEGIFLSFQNPVEIPGVVFASFLKQSYSAITEKILEYDDFRKLLEKEAKRLQISTEFLDKELNVNLSGGEKKKMEILQMLVLKPKYIIVDEVDSGLDVDAMRVVADALNYMVKQGAGLLVITHYKRILEHLKPSKVSVMKNGKIAIEGGHEIIDDIEKIGYDPVFKAKTPQRNNG